MIAFEVSHNGHHLCTAGVGQSGVLNTIVGWTLRDAPTIAATPPEHREEAAREELRLTVGGLSEGIHYRWPTAMLQPGDEVLIRVCETAAPDTPSESHPRNRDGDLAAEQDYVRRMCARWGWRLTES